MKLFSKDRYNKVSIYTNLMPGHYFLDLLTMDLQKETILTHGDDHDKYLNFNIVGKILSSSCYIKSAKYDFYQRYGDASSSGYIECIYKGKYFKLSLNSCWDYFCINGEQAEYRPSTVAICFSMYKGKLVLVTSDCVLEVSEDIGKPIDMSDIKWRCFCEDMFTIEVPSECNIFELKDNCVYMNNHKYSYEAFVLSRFDRVDKFNSQIIGGNEVPFNILASQEDYRVVYAVRCKDTENWSGTIELCNGEKLICFDKGFYYICEKGCYIIDIYFLMDLNPLHTGYTAVLKKTDKNMQLCLNRDILDIDYDGTVAVQRLFGNCGRFRYNVRICKDENSLKRSLIFDDIDDWKNTGVGV